MDVWGVFCSMFHAIRNHRHCPNEIPALLPIAESDRVSRGLPRASSDFVGDGWNIHLCQKYVLRLCHG
jgi:hypothetical protein